MTADAPLSPERRALQSINEVAAARDALIAERDDAEGLLRVVQAERNQLIVSERALRDSAVAAEAERDQIDMRLDDVAAHLYVVENERDQLAARVEQMRFALAEISDHAPFGVDGELQRLRAERDWMVRQAELALAGEPADALRNTYKQLDAERERATAAEARVAVLKRIVRDGLECASVDACMDGPKIKGVNQSSYRRWWTEHHAALESSTGALAEAVDKLMLTVLDAAEAVSDEPHVSIPTRYWDAFERAWRGGGG